MEQDTEPKVVDDGLIEFEGPNDPYLPLNWPFRKKVITTFLYGLCTMGTTWASTIYNSGLSQVQHQFNVGSEVALLGMSLYLLGYFTSPYNTSLPRPKS